MTHELEIPCRFFGIGGRPERRDQPAWSREGKSLTGKAVATSHGPESWLFAPEGTRQALTGEHAAQPWSSELTPSGAPTSYGGREGNRMPGDSANRDIRPAEFQTLRMRERSMHENREVP